MHCVLKSRRKNSSRMWNTICIFNLLYCIVNALTYNTYDRVLTTREDLEKFEEKNIADICTVTIKPCEENEWRRIDGSCSNLKYPSHGTYNTPEWRLLPAKYGKGFQPRKMKSGEDFPLARAIRLKLLEVGEGIDSKFAQSSSYFSEFTSADILSLHDTNNYVLQTTTCCMEEGLDEPMCAPNYIPENDNVHRFSGRRCFNMTKPKTFQTEGCASVDTVPSRINLATPHWDLSEVYFFNSNASTTNDERIYEGGKIRVEVVNGISLPSDAVESTTCRIKQARETGCTRYVPNSVAGSNIFTVWFWRFHNYLAEELAKVNPCWDDDTLFHAAADINIACFNQIHLYEFYAELLGKKTLMDLGILHTNDGHRDPYDEDIPPGMSTEFPYALRWFHTTQDGLQYMYDKDYNFVGTTQMVNYSLLVHDFAYDNNMLGLTRGLYLQAAGGYEDQIIHADMADLAVGPQQQAFDLLTTDLAKGRYFGFAPYVEYRDFCTDYTIKHDSFESLKSLISDTNIEELKRMYKVPENIELMAGMWSERTMKGTKVPPTVFCFIIHQLKRNIKTDRHWYERPNRPHAFCKEQLKQIRSVTLATLMCAIGDEVTKIQPRAFLRIGPGNEMVSCEEIPSIDFSHWKDYSCCE